MLFRKENAFCITFESRLSPEEPHNLPFRNMQRMTRKFKSSLLTRNITMPILFVAACQDDVKSSSIHQPIKFLNAGEMSHEALIRQACALTVSSSSQLLTQVLVAISEVSKEYRKSMSDLSQLLEYSILLLSNSPSTLENEVENKIVELRIAVDDQRKALMELVSLMEFVEKLVTSTAETAFLAGADLSSTLACERLNSVVEKVGQECAINKIAEEELLKVQQSYVIQMGEAPKRKVADAEKHGERIHKTVPMDIFNEDSVKGD